MKYLSKYKIFENFEDDKKIIKDVLLELEDKDFNIYVRKDGQSSDLKITKRYPYFLIAKAGNQNFTFSEVKDELLTIKSYLEDRWVICGVVFEHEWNRVRVDINEKDYDLLDNLFDTGTTKILNLAVFFKPED
jgi:hypothetical protein